MSTKYNRYAVELDKAFSSAAKEYGDSWSRLQEARKALDNAPTKADDAREFKRGDNEIIRIRAKAELEEAEADFRQKGEVWKDFQKTKSQLDREFKAELREDGILKADGIDEKGMTLLNSGLMKVDDFRNMMEEYSGNPTMLKMVAKTASEASEKAKEVDERQALNLIANEIGNGQSAVENSWESLCSVCDTYSGQGHRIESQNGAFVTAMNSHWNDGNVRSMIENF